MEHNHLKNENLDFQPESPSKFKIPESLKFFIHKRPVVSFFLLIAIISLFALISSFIYVQYKSNSTLTKSKEPAITETKKSLSPTPTIELSPTSYLKPTSIPTITKQITNTPTPLPTATLTPTPASTRTPNPPKMKITYPTENQSIELNSSQTFCVADSPDGGDQNGLVRRYNINNGGWTDYKSMTTLCYSPSEGSNNLKLQYKNYYDETSPEYSINFTFHRT